MRKILFVVALFAFGIGEFGLPVHAQLLEGRLRHRLFHRHHGFYGYGCAGGGCTGYYGGCQGSYGGCTGFYGGCTGSYGCNGGQYYPVPMPKAETGLKCPTSCTCPQCQCPDCKCRGGKCTCPKCGNQFKCPCGDTP